MHWLLEKLLGINPAFISEGDWHIVWRSAPPIWLLILIIIPAVIIFSYIIYRGQKTTSSPRIKLLLTLLRSAVIFITLLILFQPVAVMEKSINKEAVLGILVDNSLSMNLKDKFSSDADILNLNSLCAMDNAGPDNRKNIQNMTRIDLINAILSNPKLDLFTKLKNKSKIRTYTFASTLNPSDYGSQPSGKYKIKAEGDGTAIGNAINDFINDLSGQSVGGIVLISDGQNNLGKEPLDMLQSLKDRNYLFPIYTVVAGNPDKHKDIEISDLSAPDVATVQDFVSFNYTVKGSGLSNNESVRIILSEKQAGDSRSEIVAEDTVYLTPPICIYTGSIKYKPTKIGNYIYELKTPVQQDESIEENNSMEHYLKVVSNLINILYIESYPRWEYRRLKNALIRDSTLKTSLLLISSDPDFPQDASTGVAPLVDFPATPKELFKYDIIIWGDVNPEHLIGPQITYDKLMDNIKRFVEEMGGGIAFITGERFNPRSFRKTILTDLLPLSMEDDDYSTGLKENITEPFKVKVTPEGFSDSIMRLEDNFTLNQQLWNRLPGFYWYYPFKKAKPAARVMAVHPLASNKYGLRPIMATQYYGQGRTFVNATDETWRWQSLKGDKYFYTFWSEVIRFLRGNRIIGTKRVQITTDKPKYAIGEKVKLTAKLYDRDFRPIKQPYYNVSIEDLSNDTTSTAKNEITLNSTPDKEGQYEGTFTPSRIGHYRVWASPVDIMPKEEDKSSASFYVQYPRREYEKPLPDSALLKNIADKTNGAFLKLTEINKLPEIVKPVSDIIYTETKEDDIWDTPLVFILFLLIISSEWILRKIIGLI
ncbi:MAG: hypothetical protein V1709_00010 [Planctomycetota bacterium]